MKGGAWPTIALALACALAAPRAWGDVLVGDRNGLLLDNTPHSAFLVRVDQDTAAVVAATDVVQSDFMDMTVSEDGWLYATGLGLVERHRPDASVLDLRWLFLTDAWDVAVESAGSLLVLDRWRSVGDSSSGIYRVDPGTRAVTFVDSIPGINLMGMDVPRSGPYEDGVFAIGFDPARDNQFLLWRWSRLGDGSLAREGPFGPLAVSPFDTCIAEFGWLPRHPTARHGRDTFLVAEGCSRRVLEFDYDGNLVRVFATIAPDPTLTLTLGFSTGPYPLPPNNVLVTPEDHVWVAAQRRAYHYDPDGVLLATVDRVFNQAVGICQAEWVPFETAGSTCDPRGQGYWKRQCLGEDQGNPMLHVRRGAGTPAPVGPALHPSRRGLTPVPTLIDRVSRRLTPYGVTACEALWPARPSEPLSKALRSYAAVLFNLEDKRLHRRCPVDRDGTPTTAGAVLDQVEDLLAEGTDTALREAARLAAILTHDSE